MKERPILFKGAMVRALLDGSKTQTRRIVKPQPIPDTLFSGGYSIAPTKRTKGTTLSVDAPYVGIACPYGHTGDRLWVRETFAPIYPQDPTYNGGQPIEYDYAATYKHGDRLGDLIGIKKVWRPSIHMPRWASRITLEIIKVRVERLQDISAEDCISEGLNTTLREHDAEVNLKHQFKELWVSTGGDWAANPFVWVVEFRRLS